MSRTRTYLAAIFLFGMWACGYVALAKGWGLEVKSWPWYLGALAGGAAFTAASIALTEWEKP